MEDDYVLGDGYANALGDLYKASKERHHFPITVGAWHWFHVNTGGPNADGYGIPGLNGTYFYYLQAAPEYEVNWGDISKIGAYAEIRLRDGGDPFRGFIPNSVIWPYEAYAWVDTPLGRLKGGSVWKRFGFDWDGSWWGNAQYFDGFKLDTDWGVSLEETPAMEDGFKVDRYLQFFFHENNVNGSFVGGDAESVIGSAEHNTLVARVVPTWQLAEEETLAIGVSGLVGQIVNAPLVYPSTGGPGFVTHGNVTEAAWAVDVTYTRGGLRAYVEGLQSYGVRNPFRYVSGGPSNRVTDLIAGFNYQHGPWTFRFNFSSSLDANPSGTQLLYVPGFTLAFTQNVELWVDYTHEEIHGNPNRTSPIFENGLQMVVHWAY